MPFMYQTFDEIPRDLGFPWVY